MLIYFDSKIINERCKKCVFNTGEFGEALTTEPGLYLGLREREEKKLTYKCAAPLC